MNIVVIDIGNTLCKGAIFKNGQIQFVIITKKISKLFEWIKKYKPQKIICVSVQKRENIINKWSDCFDIVFLDSAIDYPPIQNQYRTRITLGIDRWCNVIGAFALGYRFPYLVIDLGTALTVDYVDEKGSYQGGVISPGIRLRFSSLYQGTARLPLLQGYIIPPFPGKDTQESILLGVLEGILHEIKGWIQKTTKNATCIITGGDSWWLGYHLGKNANVEPFLTFVGAYALYRHLFAHD